MVSYQSFEFIIFTILSLLDNGTFICNSDQLMCDNSTKCIFGSLEFFDTDYVCDGHRQCQDGKDEDIDECKARNIFPKEATFQCLENNRPGKYTIEIMAIPCNGKWECKNGEDEIGCDISFIYLLIFLLIGFTAISVVAGLFDNYHKRATDFENIELEGPKREDIPFEERHQDIDRAKKIAFSQGAIDRKHQNRALIASESSFHNNFATGILCLKASCCIFFLSPFSLFSLFSQM